MHFRLRLKQDFWLATELRMGRETAAAVIGNVHMSTKANEDESKAFGAI